MQWKPLAIAAAVLVSGAQASARHRPRPTSTSSSTHSTSTHSTTHSTSTSKSTSTSAHTAPSTSTAPAAAATRYLLTFGDSYSQTGFNVSGAAPAAGNLLGNPAFPGYTTANGNQSNWIGDLIAVHNATLTLSYNFASGGATTDADLIAGYEPYPTVLSFVNQVSEFTSSSVAKGPWTSGDALFGVWLGVNDVGNGWYQSNWSTLVTQVIQVYFQQVQLLYNAGARNFLFLTVPPITRSPLVLNSSDASSIAQEAAAIVTYSNLVSSAAANFSSANKDAKTWVFNTTTPFSEALDNPTAYGATNATCYDSSGTECLWFNNYHPGSTIHALVAGGIAKEVGAPWFR